MIKTVLTMSAAALFAGCGFITESRAAASLLCNPTAAEWTTTSMQYGFAIQPLTSSYVPVNSGNWSITLTDSAGATASDASVAYNNTAEGVECLANAALGTSTLMASVSGSWSWHKVSSSGVTCSLVSAVESGGTTTFTLSITNENAATKEVENGCQFEAIEASSAESTSSSTYADASASSSGSSADARATTAAAAAVPRRYTLVRAGDGAGTRFSGTAMDVDSAGAPVWYGLSLSRQAVGVSTGTPSTPVAGSIGEAQGTLGEATYAGSASARIMGADGTETVVAVADLRLTFIPNQIAAILDWTDGSGTERRVLESPSRTGFRQSGTRAAPGVFAAQDSGQDRGARYAIDAGRGSASIDFLYFDRNGAARWVRAEGATVAGLSASAFDQPAMQYWRDRSGAVRSVPVGNISAQIGTDRVRLTAPWSAGAESLDRLN